MLLTTCGFFCFISKEITSKAEPTTTNTTDQKIMKCEKCKKEFVPNEHARNVKFCSKYCRNKTHYDKRGGAEYQREYLAKRNNADKPSENKIQCLLCGKHYRKVGAHIVWTHKITRREYREHFDLEVKRGLLTEIEREPLRENVFSNGTVENLKKGRKYWFKKGSKTAGRYKRSHITLQKLRKRLWV